MDRGWFTVWFSASLVEPPSVAGDGDPAGRTTHRLSSVLCGSCWISQEQFCIQTIAYLCRENIFSNVPFFVVFTLNTQMLSQIWISSRFLIVCVLVCCLDVTLFFFPNAKLGAFFYLENLVQTLADCLMHFGLICVILITNPSHWFAVVRDSPNERSYLLLWKDVFLRRILHGCVTELNTLAS